MCCKQTEFFQKLINEIIVISELGETPDGDGVNVPTLLWAEGWAEIFKAERAE